MSPTHIASRLLLSVALTATAAPPAILLHPDPSGAPVIAPAIEKAPPGATLRLAKGVYREYVAINKPLRLEGEDGAIIDPSSPLGARFQPAPEYGKGVYKATLPDVPYSVFIDGAPLAQVNPDRSETKADGPWFWKTLLASGTPRTGFHFIRGLWLYHREERTLYLHLENDADPAAHTWTAVWRRDAGITISNTENAAVDRLTVQHAYSGISISNGAKAASVTFSRVGPWDKNGIMLRSGATGSLIEDNQVFRSSYESFVPVANSKDWYEIWQLHKTAGMYDRVGISLSLSGAGNRIHRNHVHDTFDGIDIGENEFESLDTPLPSNDYDRDTEVWENLIEHTGDSGIEIGGPAINLRIHHNTLRRTHGGLRYKLPRIGPIFIYRNVLVDGSPFNIWYSMDDSPAEAYVYHNTIVGSTYGLRYSSMNAYRETGARNWHYLNNLIVTERGFFEGNSTAAKRVPMGFTTDYNVVQGEGRPYPEKSPQDRHSRYVPDARMAPGFPPKPLPASPAVDAGFDLSTYFHGKPLPGCEPGYFRGPAPDAGAYEIQ